MRTRLSVIVLAAGLALAARSTPALAAPAAGLVQLAQYYGPPGYYGRPGFHHHRYWHQRHWHHWHHHRFYGGRWRSW